MPITFLKDSNTFFLTANKMSYVFKLYENGRLLSLYFGAAVPPGDLSHLHRRYDRGFCANPHDAPDRTFSLDTTPGEYPFFGTGDFHCPAGELLFEDGSGVTDFRYTSHTITKGKEVIENFPETTGSENDCETLTLVLTEQTTGMELKLYYTVFEKLNVITRKAEFVNRSDRSVSLNRAMSLSVDLPDSDFEILSLYGAHCKERHLDRTPLRHGVQSVESRRGASSHMQNPFLALARQNTGERFGEVYGFNLIYSGNHLCQAEVDQFDTVRIQCGVNPFGFGWELAPGGSFMTPECVMVYSDEGLGGMSRTFHDLYRDHLGFSKYTKGSRPIIINNWEATYFDFDESKLFEIIDSAAGLGIDTFVLDDGWFLGRNDDNSSLGDWTVDREKLTGGLDPIIARCKQHGMNFGIWFEPEMISQNSNLFRAHPDWAIGAPGRPHSTSRSQLTLDLTKEEVQEYIIGAVSDILKNHDITYVKWDMNRHITECCSTTLPANRMKEFHHRYILGLYKVLSELTKAFPDVLFESCSGGGGRFDPAMLYYMPQTWTSDNSDAAARLKIQYGTSLVYPCSSMVGHVSAVPNHQLGRITPFITRANAAMSLSFGYELNPKLLSNEDRNSIAASNAYYKNIQPLVISGDFYRLLSPYEDENCAWMLVSKTKTFAVAWYFETLAKPAPAIKRLKFEGLCADKTYRVEETGTCHTGAELMNVGLSLPWLSGDFQSLRYTIKEKI